MQRLLSVDDFFIAFYDEARNETHYELEIAEGTRMPKRTRPAGNHLSEYMLRTRQPVLIRENFSEEVKRMDCSRCASPAASAACRSCCTTALSR